MQIVKLDSVPDEAFEAARVKPKLRQDRVVIRTATESAIAICRDNGEAICVIGTRRITMTDPWAVLWVLWIAKDVSRGEFRTGKKLWEEWAAKQGTRVVEVDPTDSVANRFVRWLGFEFWMPLDGYNIYRKG